VRYLRPRSTRSRTRRASTPALRPRASWLVPLRVCYEASALWPKGAGELGFPDDFCVLLPWEVQPRRPVGDGTCGHVVATAISARLASLRCTGGVVAGGDLVPNPDVHQNPPLAHQPTLEPVGATFPGGHG
jgi:hypothetical protein